MVSTFGWELKTLQDWGAQQLVGIDTYLLLTKHKSFSNAGKTSPIAWTGQFWDVSGVSKTDSPP